MITRTDTSWQAESSLSWQQQLQQAITEPRTLIEYLGLPARLLPAAERASHQFPLRVPLAFADRMARGNEYDPLLQQVLPIDHELITSTGASKDPVGEQNNQQPGLIQKYAERVLLVVNGHCAVNCRYCFRRHFPYEDNRLSRSQWQQTLEHIAEDQSISEVIYSGGDPLASSDKQLSWLTEQIAAIPHIKRLRIHSRLPVVIPDRITDECLQWLTQDQFQTVFVLHINHPNEIDSALVAAVKRMKQCGITLLNQSVLLKGINDDVSTLKSLSEALFDSGILPYYLHLFDQVLGAAHFDVPREQATQLHEALLACLPGYLVPKFVKEIAGKSSKTPLELIEKPLNNRDDQGLTQRVMIDNPSSP